MTSSTSSLLSKGCCCYLLYDESAVVDNVDERRRGFDPQVSGDKVLSVADPQHDPAKVDAQVTEQDLPVVEVGLGELEDGGRGVAHSHQLAVGNRVVVVPEKTFYTFYSLSLLLHKRHQTLYIVFLYIWTNKTYIL